MKVRSITRRKAFFGSLLMLLLVGVWGVTIPAPTTADTQAFPFQFAPITSPSTISFASTAVVDVDSDGDMEIFTADAKGRVWGWDHTGNSLPGYPVYTNDFEERIDGPLAVGDLNGDGRVEIVAGTRGDEGNPAGRRGKVYIWTWDSPGNWLPGWPEEMPWNEAYGTGRAEVYSVALANVAGDAGLEIIAGTSNNATDGGSKTLNEPNLHVWDLNSNSIGNFPRGYRTAGIWGNVAAADLNGDGYAETVVGRDHLYLHAYDSNGEWLPNYPLRTPIDEDDIDNRDWGSFSYLEFTRGAPAIGDIDGDGIMEIAAAGKMRNEDHDVTNNGVLVIEPDGDRQPGWETAKIAGGNVSGDFQSKQAVSMADLTGDGRLEIVVPFRDGFIRAYRYDGSLLWEYDYAQGKKLMAGEGVIGNIDANPAVEIVFGTYNPESDSNRDDVRLYALDAYGNLVDGFPLELPEEDNNSKSGIRSAPTLADLDADCDVEILAVSREGVLYAWDLSAPYYWDKMPWPTSRHDNYRTAAFNGPQLSNNSACSASVPLEPRIWFPVVWK